MVIDPKNEPDGVIFILIHPDSTVLLQLRDSNSKYFPNMWVFPGGSCDDGEDHISACVREAEEEFEAGLNPNNCTLLMKRLNDKNWVYVCPIDNSKKLVLHEGADFGWKTIEEIKDLDLGYEQSDIVGPLEDFLQRK